MNAQAATYLNRLSDLLFILARVANVERGDVLARPAPLASECSDVHVGAGRRRLQPGQEAGQCSGAHRQLDRPTAVGEHEDDGCSVRHRLGTHRRAALHDLELASPQ